MNISTNATAPYSNGITGRNSVICQEVNGFRDQRNEVNSVIDSFKCLSPDVADKEKQETETKQHNDW